MGPGLDTRARESWPGVRGAVRGKTSIRLSNRDHRVDWGDDFNNFNTRLGFPLSCQSCGRNTQQYGRDLVCDKICVSSLLTMHICVWYRPRNQSQYHGLHHPPSLCLLIIRYRGAPSCKKLICNQNCTKQFRLILWL